MQIDKHMGAPSGPHLFGHTASLTPGHWVRLRTLVVLRWCAILGQIAAMAVSAKAFSLHLSWGLTAIVIGLAVIANLLSLTLCPKNARLNERHATGMLLFDTVQLALMVLLTGGLHNPFIVFIVAPVTVAATALSTRATIVVGCVAIAATTFVGYVNIPLQLKTGTPLLMPDLFVFGVWISVVTTIVFVGLYTRRISSEMHSMSAALLATQMALSREQKLTDLSGVVAAAAHELGTPLATIKLTASELAEELSDRCELREDADLIHQQANRCRDILHSMGRAGKDDMMIKTVPLVSLIEEAAEPHQDRGKTIDISVVSGTPSTPHEPIVHRQPEVIHGLRNLIQNAVDFATTTVWVEVGWNDDEIKLKIIDDGPGYSPQIIGWIGDPFIGGRKNNSTARQEYKGMGLGLFIAKTLLERTGARLSFANGMDPYTARARPREKSGAIAQVIWPRGNTDHTNVNFEKSQTHGALGDNLPFLNN